MNAVVKTEQENLPAAQQMTPMQMLGHAVQQGMPIETLRELMQMKREWEADEARRQFNEAFAAFKAEAIVIIKNTEIKDGPLKGKKHANLFDVVSAVTPKLSAHGLTIAWKLTKEDKDWMEVTCTLRHSAGHAETVSMGGPPDVGPGRNAIQARCSTKTYLERYTATAILGLATQDADDDGNGGNRRPPPEAPKGYDKWKADMRALADEGLERLQAAWGVPDKKAFRQYVAKHDSAWWDEAKAKAAKVSQ